MPTPFYHLMLALPFITPEGQEAELGFLPSQQPAFLLGSTAPDVQTISGQERSATHFFELPLRHGDVPPWERFLASQPELDRLAARDAERLAFVLGYACHLQADWIWVRDIYAPLFGPGCAWGTRPHRQYVHNVLRAYLDRQVLSELPRDLGSLLEQAKPAGWLTHDCEPYLAQWRDWLVQQLSVGGAAQTVEVFAARQGIDPQVYYDLLDSEERLEQEIFSRLPRARLVEYRRNVWDENSRLLQPWLQRPLSEPSHPTTRS